MNNTEFESYIKAGNIAKEVREFSKYLVKPGTKLIKIALAIDDKIYELGGEPAFPVNLSMDEIAAHYTPELNDETVANGILKIDLGVSVNGFIADTSFSVDLTVDERYKKMNELNTKILDEVKKIIRPKMKIFEVGEKVQEILEKYNGMNGTTFSAIKSLSGHELGENVIHAGLTISNYRNKNETELDEIAFAIEPFLTTGAGDVYEGKPGGIYALNSNLQARDSESRKILNFIKENYKTRPFCLRWLEKNGFYKIKFMISNLVKQGILHQYPLLIEKTKSPVSQFEHTFVIHNGKAICTTD
ncbi:MAG: type II methionyl aminopeptidase [Candidatus Pacearchaeota archaeon]